MVFERLTSFWGFGLICTVGVGCLAGGYRAITKRLTIPGVLEEPLSVYHILAIRQFVIFIAALPSVSATRAPLRGFSRRTWIFLFLRSSIALLTAALTQFALTLLTLPDYATINSIQPILTSLVSWPTLKERPKLSDIPIFSLSLAGVIFIIQPAFLFGGSSIYSPPNPIGIIFAVSAVFSGTLMNICVRALRDVPAATVNFYYGGSTSLISLAIYLIFFPQWPPCSALIRFELIAAGSLITLSVLLHFLAGRSLPAAIMSLYLSIELVFQLVLQIAVYQTFPQLYSIIGAGLVMLGMVFLISRNYLLRNVKITEPENMSNLVKILSY